MNEPASLAAELASLPPEVESTFAALGFGKRWLIERACAIGRSNQISATLAAPPPLLAWRPSTEDFARGQQILARGEVAICVLAGGMATRMSSVCKALVEFAPGLTFLDARLREQAAIGRQFGATPPLWLMVSQATAAPVERALVERRAESATTFAQNVSLRLLPNGSLFRLASGLPSLHATGHGDVVDGLRRSGLLQRFVEGGGRYVFIANLDNLGATLDPVLIGHFATQDAPLAVELCDKQPGDRGGIPVVVNGATQILEEFRLPVTFDPTQVSVFNTNTMLADARALLACDVPWSWFSVEKTVEERRVIQFERLLGEITGALPTSYVRVPRDGSDSRFLPVKDANELELRRATIVAVLKIRGIL